jgi:hypothetical protein
LFPLLNRAARYFPILREIGQLVDLNNGCRVLEVGSGSIGLGEFWAHEFVGCDLLFPGKPRAHMRAVRCSGARLPFADEYFDVVVASDVMEHVPPEWRQTVVAETLRVSRAVAVFGFPCGPAAHALDRRIRDRYLRRKMTPPIWLQEHMMNAFPDAGLFSDVRDSWKVKSIPNENLDFHHRMMQAEMYRPLDYLFRIGLLIVPRLIEKFLQRIDREPSYRRIFILSKQ